MQQAFKWHWAGPPEYDISISALKYWQYESAQELNTFWLDLINESFLQDTLANKNDGHKNLNLAHHGHNMMPCKKIQGML